MLISILKASGISRMLVRLHFWGLCLVCLVIGSQVFSSCLNVSQCVSMCLKLSQCVSKCTYLLLMSLKELGTPMLPLGTEIGLALEDGSADVSPFV